MTERKKEEEEDENNYVNQILSEVDKNQNIQPVCSSLAFTMSKGQIYW